jgi:hypothetical protein
LKGPKLQNALKSKKHKKKEKERKERFGGGRGEKLVGKTNQGQSFFWARSLSTPKTIQALNIPQIYEVCRQLEAHSGDSIG